MTDAGVMQELLDDQAGIVARRQLLAAGLLDQDIRRLVRRRELAVVHPGVYADHTGEPTWLQRAWAGVLFAWPAALAGQSALRAFEGPGRSRSREGAITVAVDHRRRVVERPGLVVDRRRSLDQIVLWNVGPPRVRYEEAVLDVALHARSDLDTIAELAAACGRRRTTAARLAETLARRSRAPRRPWLDAVLRDVAEGSSSVLEHGYLDRVERPHGLPPARRQVRAATPSGRVARDVEIDGRLVVELDGRLFHDSATARDRDMERDLDASLDGRTTVRLGWGQVFGRPCSTASKIATLLRAGGWAGAITPCGPGCSASGRISATR